MNFPYFWTPAMQLTPMRSIIELMELQFQPVMVMQTRRE